MGEAKSGISGRNKRRRGAAKNAPSGCLIVFGLPFLCAGLLITFVALRMTYRYVEARSWLPVDAEVLSKRLATARSGDTSKVVIHYGYSVDGYEYISNTYSLADMYSSGAAAKELVLNSYEVGKTYTAWYDPDKPSRAVLTRDVPLEVLAIILFGLTFSTVGASLVLGPVLAPLMQRRRLRRVEAGEEIKPEFDASIAGAWFFALFWNGVTWTVYTGFVTSGEMQWFLYFFFLPFFLIGASMLGSAFRFSLDRRAFAALRLSLRLAPIEAGQPAEFVLSDPRGSIDADEAPEISLVYLTDSRGKARWLTRYSEVISGVRPVGAGGGLTGVIVIPPEEAERLHAKYRKGKWHLRVKIGDARCHFPLPAETAVV